MNVLILSGKFGLGHLAAAKALAEQLTTSGLVAKVTIADLYETAFPGCGEMFYRSYSTLITHSGRLLNLAYKRTVYSEQEQDFGLFGRYTGRRLGQLIASLHPDLIISTYSLAARVVAEYLRRRGLSIPHVICITDVSTHNIWLNPGVDLFLVAAPETRDSLLDCGVDAARIAVSGIPVRGCFQPPAESRPGNSRQLLVMGGGLGLLPADAALFAALDELDGLHTTVICGQNKALCRRLRGQYRQIEVIGFTDRVHEYMRRADIMLSKAGGVTMFETIASELPVVIFPPFLEQEIANADFLSSHGMGIILPPSAEAAAKAINALAHDAARRREMATRMHDFRQQLDQDALLRYIRGMKRSGRWVA